MAVLDFSEKALSDFENNAIPKHDKLIILNLLRKWAAKNMLPPGSQLSPSLPNMYVKFINLQRSNRYAVAFIYPFEQSKKFHVISLFCNLVTLADTQPESEDEGYYIIDEDE